MRIRAIASAYMAGMGLFGAVGAAAVSHQQWSYLKAVDRAEELVRVIGSSNRLTEAMATERGVYEQVLASSEILRPEKGRFIAERVVATDAVFDDTLGRITALPQADVKSLSEPVEEARRIVGAARARVSKVWLGEANGDLSAAAHTLSSEYRRAATVLDQTVIQLERALAETDAKSNLLVGVSRLSNKMREAAGERSKVLSQYVATGKAHDAAANSKVTELTAGLREDWQRLERLTLQIGKSPKVETAIERTRSTFWTDAEPTYARVADAARKGSPPPMDYPAWRTWTLSMLASTLAARDAAIEQALDDLRNDRRAAVGSLAIALGSVGGAALLILAAALFLARRFVRPITQLTEGISRVADSDPGAFDFATLADQAIRLTRRYDARVDEIGLLARALNRFQQRTIQLREINERFNTALANLPQGLCVFDADQRLVVANYRYAEIYRLAPEQREPGTPLQAHLEHMVATGICSEEPDGYMANLRRTIARRQPWEMVNELPDGRVIAVRHQPMPSGGWLATHDDITDRRRAEAQIVHMARHDPLTDLPNRALFHEELGRAAARAHRGEPFAVMCLDLDHFKTVNDTLGHPIGDALLQEVAQRLRACVRDTDTVARLGGDEFAIVQVGCPQPVGASALAQRLIETLSGPFNLEGHRIEISASIGISVAPEDSTDRDQVLKNADMALYRAKADGRNAFRFFEFGMSARMQARRVLEVDLRAALNNGEFELHYMPLVLLETGEVSGFEALIRWNHPRRGLVSPGEFIPVAEETGLIGAIGAWVLRQACTEAATWPRHVKVAVNLSPAQFRNRELLIDVLGALGASGLAPDRLELEITEAVMLADTDAVLAILRRIREFGVRVSMDDFGTGYSSLSYLHKFPFDKIKIDQSFVRDVAERDNSMAIVRAISSLASSLGMSTTAEGVETAEQLERVRAEGCTEGQGYLFSPPKPASAVPELLASLRPPAKEAA